MIFSQGMQLHRKAAEERLSGNTGGMSFLARQRQASSRRSTPNRTPQANAVSSRYGSMMLEHSEPAVDLLTLSLVAT